jgi:hypothetical protein
MADYRLVHCKMWSEDDWFAELEPRRRLLWIYLFTNNDASLSGLYVIRDEKIALETGLDIVFVRETLKWFASQGKIEREKWVIWVKKMRKYQNTRSEKIQTCIRKDVNTVPDCPIKQRYMSTYSMDTVSLEPRYDSDVSDSDSDSDSDSEDESGVSVDTRGPLSHPLVKAYLHLFPVDAGATRPAERGRWLQAAREIEACENYNRAKAAGLMIFWREKKLRGYWDAHDGKTPGLDYFSKFIIAKLKGEQAYDIDFDYHAYDDEINECKSYPEWRVEEVA